MAFKVTQVLFVEDIGSYHNCLLNLHRAGFTADFRILPQSDNVRPAILEPAPGISLELLEEAFNAAVGHKPLPSLP